MKRLLSLAVIAALLALPAGASAEPSALDRAAAETLFQDAMKLMAAQDYTTACPKLEESQRVDPGMAKQFRLAECYEATGRTASAWANFVDVADAAIFAGKEDREKVARERAANLTPKLSHATIVITTPDLAGLEVRRGDTKIGKAQWGSATPVDPGTYSVTASAPGKTTWTGDLTVGADAASVSLTVPALEDVPNEVAPATTQSSDEAVLAKVRAESERIEKERAEELSRVQAKSTRTLGVVFAVLGGATAITGGVLAGVAKANYDSAGANCQGNLCNQSGYDTTTNARNLANTGTVFILVGSGLAAVGLAFVIFTPSKSPARARAGLGPRGFLLEGSF